MGSEECVVNLREATMGKWKGLLSNAGLEDSFLTGNHGACPLCGGKDRYRWDNKDGRGTMICSACGSRDGVQLLMEYKGWDFKTAASWLEAQVDFVPEEKVQYRPRNATPYLSWVYKNSHSITRNTESGRYLLSRGISGLSREAAANLFHVPNLKLGDGYHPAMVGLIRNPSGLKVNIHRTWITPTGHDRKVGPGDIPPGSAIRLGPVRKVMGVAEGIETALSFGALHKIPTWALISNTILEKWEPPEGCEKVIIAGDNDKNFVGQASAYALACKLSRKGYEVEVRLPDEAGTDWNDAAKDTG